MPTQFPAPPAGRTGWPWQAAPPPASPCGEAAARPRISIVTPSFNQGEFLEETIRSVLCQGYPNLEYIIIDGGSGDGSVDIIRRYEPWLAHWESAPDRGQAHAINKGLRRSSGELVAYLNADDLYLPDTLQSVADRFAAHPQVDLLYGDCRVIDQASRVTGHWRSRPFDAVVELCRNFIFQPTVFLRRALYERVGDFNEQLDCVMDIDYWYRAIHTAHFAYVRRELASFRIHSRSKTGQRRARFIAERYEILERFLGETRQQELRGERRRIMAWHHFHAGEQLYHAGDAEAAEREFMRSIQLTPWSVRTVYALLARLDSLLKTRLFRLAQKIHDCSP